MKLLTTLALLVFSPLAFAQDRSWEAKLDTEFRGGKVVLNLSAGGYKILPTSAEGKIRVRWATKRADQMEDAQVKVTVKDGEAYIRTRGPKDDFRVEIEVPVRSSLRARLSVGELSIQGIEGDKDLRCRIGEIHVAVPDPQAYGHVDARVKIGAIGGRPFGGSKDGFFRSFCWEGEGSFQMDARVGIGAVRFK